MNILDYNLCIGYCIVLVDFPGEHSLRRLRFIGWLSLHRDGQQSRHTQHQRHAEGGDPTAQLFSRPDPCFSPAADFRKGDDGML